MPKTANKSGWVNPQNLTPRNQLEKDIIDNLWKVKRLSRVIHTMTGIPVDELESVGSICLMKTAKNYKVDGAANFSTWVNRCLFRYYLNYLRDKSRLIKVPRKYSNLYLKIKKLKQSDSNISFQEIAKKLNKDPEEVREVWRCFKSRILDLNHFEEEIVGEESYNLISKDVHIWLDTDKLKKPQTGKIFSSELVKQKLTLFERSLIFDVLVRGLCDNTLKREYNTKNVDALMNATITAINKLYETNASKKEKEGQNDCQQ